MKLNDFLLEEAAGGEAMDSSAGSGGETPSNDSGTGSPAGSPAPANNAHDPASTEAPWYASADEQTAAFIKNKGWDEDPLRVVAGYRSLEKHLGTAGKDPESLFTLPREDDPEGQAALWKKLGAGETAADYAYEVPEEAAQLVPQEELAFWQERFAAEGIPVTKAKALIESSIKYRQEQVAAMQKDYENAIGQEREALKSEWRDGYDKQMQRAKAARQHLGIPDEAVQGIESQIGYKATVKLFADIGAKFAEQKFVAGGDGSGGSTFDTYTPDEAQSKIQDMMLDENTVKALTDTTHPGHKAAVERRRKLFEIAYPD